MYAANLVSGFSRIVQVLNTSTSAWSREGASPKPSDSSVPLMRSESCAFIWHPKVVTKYLRTRPRVARACGPLGSGPHAFGRLRLARQLRVSPRLEVPVELPAGHVVAELLALDYRVAEVEAEPDACIDDLLLHVLDGVEVLGRREQRAAVLAARHGHVDVVRAERGGKRVAEGGREAAVLGRVFGMPGHAEERLPGRIGGRGWVALLFGGPGPPARGPETVEKLRAETGDARAPPAEAPPSPPTPAPGADP